jgi:hypothetical protein
MDVIVWGVTMMLTIKMKGMWLYSRNKTLGFNLRSLRSRMDNMSKDAIVRSQGVLRNIVNATKAE